MRSPDPISAAVKLLDPPAFTVKQAAKRVGRSVDTLKRWRTSGLYVPARTMEFGSTTVHLYTEDDIDNMKALAKTQRPGRKKKDA